MRLPKNLGMAGGKARVDDWLRERRINVLLADTCKVQNRHQRQNTAVKFADEINNRSAAQIARMVKKQGLL